MILIDEKQDCCGCSACIQICPKSCIIQLEDEEGFLYPKVDTESCIDCDLCKKVCPFLDSGKPRLPQKVYAIKNRDEEIRRQSSSGGLFTLLAEQVIEKGGIVFGARFNECWEVVHGYTEMKEGLAAFRGSKYVQSRIDDNYQKAQQFLKSGRTVLFSGTPCQIAGLRLFLRKDYESLLTVDFICHGVPSPGVWAEYLHEEIVRQCEKTQFCTDMIPDKDALVKRISFRDKSYGWKDYSFALDCSLFAGERKEKKISYCERASGNPFLKGFVCDLYLRPSCHSCKMKSGRSGSDITIADFWGGDLLYPSFCDEGGCSVAFVNTEKKIDVHILNCESIELPFEDAIKSNPSFFKSVSVRRNRKLFFKEKEQGKEGVIRIINRYAPYKFMERVMNYLRRYFK